MATIEMLKKIAKRRAMKNEMEKGAGMEGGGTDVAPLGMPRTPMNEGMGKTPPAGMMGEGMEEKGETESPPQTGGIMGSADAIKSVADSGDFAIGGASGTLTLPTAEHSKLASEGEGMNVIAIISGKATPNGDNVSIAVDEASVIHGNPKDYKSRMDKMKSVAKARAGKMSGGNY